MRFLMALTKEDVEHIAHLARLEVSDDEIAEYVAKLSGIIDFVAQLGELETSAVEPMAHPLDMGQRLREDNVTEQDQREDLQCNAADVNDGYYIVPRVID